MVTFLSMEHPTKTPSDCASSTVNVPTDMSPMVSAESIEMADMYEHPENARTPTDLAESADTVSNDESPRNIPSLTASRDGRKTENRSPQFSNAPSPAYLSAYRLTTFRALPFANA